MIWWGDRIGGGWEGYVKVWGKRESSSSEWGIDAIHWDG